MLPFFKDFFKAFLESAISEGGFPESKGLALPEGLYFPEGFVFSKGLAFPDGM